MQGRHGLCPSVPKTFLNAHTCVPSQAGCAKPLYSSAKFELNQTSARSFYELDGLYVYVVSGLRLDDEDPPCRDTVTRWKRVDDDPQCTGAAVPGGSELDETTFAWFQQLLEEADDGARVVDISSRNTRECLQADKGIRIAVQDNSTGVPVDRCWDHVHFNELSVYDMSYWTEHHDGNRDAWNAYRPNPIRAPALRGSADMVFPSWHTMSRWNGNDHLQTYMGRLGETVDFADLPRSVQSSKMAAHFGSSLTGEVEDDGFESCGSPGETTNAPEDGFLQYMTVTEDDNINQQQILDQYTQDRLGSYTKSNIWLDAVMNAPDQLRQRMAWALAQVFVVSEEGIARDREAEIYANYYDIFVRHAFGNYRDVLREVSYSPAMGIMLTFLESRSLYYWLQRNVRSQADENYPREIMQLFTMGLWELNHNGTLRLNAKGDPMMSYTNDDIVDYARAWTGFDQQLHRDNIENWSGNLNQNNIDPMFIQKDWRDTFPKLGLRNRYVGDGYPACWDLPPQDFLRKGARYLYLGQDPMGKLNGDSTYVRNYPVMTLNATSSKLFQALCGARGVDATCDTMRGEVILSSTIPCDGTECSVQSVRTVQVNRAGKKPVYFEFVRAPCVEFAYPEEGRQLPLGDRYRESSLCIDSRLQAGVAACKTSSTDSRGWVPCSNYGAEHYDAAEAVRRCEAQGYSMMESNDPIWPSSCGRYNLARSWGTSNCSVHAKIHPDGRVSVGHVFEPLADTKGDIRVRLATDDYGFRVHWNSSQNAFPTAADAAPGRPLNASC